MKINFQCPKSTNTNYVREILADEIDEKTGQLVTPIPVTRAPTSAAAEPEGEAS